MLQSGYDKAKRSTKCRRPGCSRGSIIKNEGRYFIVTPPALTKKAYSIRSYYHIACKPTIHGQTLRFPVMQTSEQKSDPQPAPPNQPPLLTGSPRRELMPSRDPPPSIDNPTRESTAPRQQMISTAASVTYSNGEYSDDWSRYCNYLSKDFKLYWLGIGSSEWDEFTALVECDGPENSYKMEWYLNNLMFDHFPESFGFSDMTPFLKIEQLRDDFGNRWQAMGSIVDFENGRNDKDRAVCAYHQTECAYNCAKCACYCSAEEIETYADYIAKAKVLQNDQDWSAAFDMIMNALDICSQDNAIHAKCIFIAEKMGVALDNDNQ
eukprot:32788_1